MTAAGVRALFWRLCLLAYCGLIYWLSDQSGLPAPDLFGGQDKLIHAAVYAVLAWLFWQGWQASLADRPLLLAILALLFCSACGLGDEWHQSFVAGRDASALDWLADSAGAALMLLWRWRLGPGRTPAGSTTLSAESATSGDKWK